MSSREKKLEAALKHVRDMLFTCCYHNSKCSNLAKWTGYGYDIPELCDMHKHENDNFEHPLGELAQIVEDALKNEH